MVGQKLKLECEASGDPAPQVKWKKDGSPQIPRAKLESPGNTTLVIESVILEDSGIYYCEVHNRVGVGSFRSWVTIIKRDVAAKVIEKTGNNIKICLSLYFSVCILQVNPKYLAFV